MYGLMFVFLIVFITSFLFSLILHGWILFYRFFTNVFQFVPDFIQNSETKTHQAVVFFVAGFLSLGCDIR